MDIATLGADCLILVQDLLIPVIMMGVTINDQIELVLYLVFKNNKYRHESTVSGIMDIFKLATRVATSALEPGMKQYTL